MRPAKLGRPSLAHDEDSVRRVRRCRPMEPKTKSCAFLCDNPTDGELHLVLTDTMGTRFLDIKTKTRDDKVRANLSLLLEVGDAAANEMWYHRDCLRNVERQCYSFRFDCTGVDDNITKHMCDIEIVNAVKCSLSSGAVLSMNDVNYEYLSTLTEHGVSVDSSDFKRHLKSLITENISTAEFVRPHRLNESEHIINSKTLSVAVGKVVPQDSGETLSDIVRVTKLLRDELLNCKDKWHFTGNMSFENPPMVAFFLKQLLFGTNAHSVSGKRDGAIKNTVSIVSQVLVQNVKSVKQVRHTPKSGVGFVSHTETPLNIGLALSVHNKVRSKQLVNFLSDLHLGTSYSSVLNIENRVECGVVERMKSTGGYCIPTFVKKGKSVFFAIDNIDFLEDTCDGQNTLHGTVVVMNQEDTDEGEVVSQPLIIPDKVTPVRQDVVYLEDPRIIPKATKFDTYKVNANSGLLKRYATMDRSWMLAWHLGNNTVQCNSEDVTINANTSFDDRTAGGTLTEDLDPVVEEDTNEDTTMPATSDHQQASRPTSRLNKHPPRQSLMPTWSATNSLLLQLKDCKSTKTHSEVVAPLFRQAPTDYATLYTVLSLTQNISAVVMGPDRKTVITLDLDLYERAVKIQESEGNTNWVLRAGELHICFAALHALGKYIEGSGLDTVAIEKGIYSPTTLRHIYGGKAFTRGIEYHTVNALACYVMKYEQLDADDTSVIAEQC